MPYGFEYQNDYAQENSSINDAEIQGVVRRSPQEFASWLDRRNSPICDYRLQFRPLPLTSALCAYGQNNKVETANQMNPFKYG